MEPNFLLTALVILLLEGALSASWSRFYFTVGIPIYRREAPAFNPGAPIPEPKVLEERFSKPPYPSLLFRLVGPDRLAFRERAWGEFTRFSYTAVMHGLLIFDRQGSVVRAVGLANWFTLAFSVLMLIALWSFGSPAPAITGLLFLSGLLGVIYRIQARRFLRGLRLRCCPVVGRRRSSIIVLAGR